MSPSGQPALQRDPPSSASLKTRNGQSHPRDVRRAELEARITQQRLDISHAMQDLETATAPIDRGWAKIQQYRGPLVLLGGLIAARGGFKPKKGLSLVKRGLMGWVMIRRLRVLFNK
ncbi:YqjK-like family protein [Cobetia crustatorum]|uniref:YqjK-like family protein n=1 Tax=Cobetia crustatorum TaxID=553385 RepID=UPI0004681A31|nr:YqjK-like family protein [Cobetia crustatorum]